MRAGRLRELLAALRAVGDEVGDPEPGCNRENCRREEPEDQLLQERPKLVICRVGHGASVSKSRSARQPHTFRATSATTPSFARSSSIVSALPSTDVANPHCDETASRSSGTYLLAASILLASSSTDSSR